MALTISVVQSCIMLSKSIIRRHQKGRIHVHRSIHKCFSDECLRNGITFEAERGYRNALGRKMRFNNFIFSKISKICSRSKHKFAGKLVDSHNTASISDRSKLLHKVSVLLGYDGLPDFIENERAQEESGLTLKDAVDDFDVSLACKQFPSIILGRSPMLELFDGTTCYSENGSLLAAQVCEEFLPSSPGAKWVGTSSLSETWPSQYPSFPNENSSVLREENSYPSLKSVQSSTWETKPKSDLQFTTEEPSTRDGLRTRQNVASIELILDKTISCISGLSKRQYNQLENCGFHTLRKLLHHFPRTYADLQNAQIGIEDGKYLIFIGRVLSSRAIRTSPSFSFLEVVVGCEVADCESTSELMVDVKSQDTRIVYLHLKKFFRGTRFAFLPFLKSIQEKYKEGDVVCVSGKVKTMNKKDHYEIREYDLDVLEDGQDLSVHAKGRPYPIYPSKGRLNPNFLREIILRALQALPGNVDPIPEDVTQDFGLVCLRDAYIGIHQPKNLNEADLARKRLIFDEFFYLQLGRLFQLLEGPGTQIEKDRLLDRYRKPELNAVFVEEWSILTKKFLKALPYSLTSSQLSAVSEIIWDLKQPVPMNRLLQGDVGCGKTVVAFLACMEVVGSGYQAALMVPTELLAIQHYEHLLNLLENVEDVQCKPSVALLTGSTPTKQSRLIRQGLQTGDISLVIGTHSLIAEKVEFSTLRIAVVDEQHRFGVIQRGRFNSKLYYNSVSSRMARTNSDGSSNGDAFMAPHVLAMTATPIPRTLALALYGDMSLTQITDLPPGRTPVQTYTIEGNENGFEKVYQMVLDELKGGGKVYLVYPVIEQSEQLPQLRAASADLEIISSRFSGYKCGLLHGRMKSDEKDEALRQFRSGDVNILLSTQVIEIGVDVPDASMMIVMNAERFGIAQLHQLRGRVGRGVRKSKCILITSTASSLSRLKVLEKSSDGFYLANMDLILRGPGDLLGKKQSGHLPEFPVARLEIDGNILQEAHLAALDSQDEEDDWWGV
ncbi:ATP-dependent DNA helicase homolog RECG, chloroplastic isoform X2 [Cornus florida]|uniref:ATP-dependent DNA helicase homolog RECG, chloroplastic isoform X2 n=1 Tax=Cornus florida TaxID=4283 RepID=UPI00289796F4|nr:ATP-dependent DNA helicase homolog RECG, chloroplastic isoform X2 [Cornus florida]